MTIKMISIVFVVVLGDDNGDNDQRPRRRHDDDGNDDNDDDDDDDNADKNDGDDDDNSNNNLARMINLIYTAQFGTICVHTTLHREFHNRYKCIIHMQSVSQRRISTVSRAATLKRQKLKIQLTISSIQYLVLGPACCNPQPIAPGVWEDSQ